MANDISRIAMPDGDISDIRANKLAYGECSTAAATTAKTVTIFSGATGSDSSVFVLEKGSSVLVKFTTTNTGATSNLTLNVNGTGAKAIKYRNADLTSPSLLAANRIYQFIYDGTYWQLTGDLDTNTNLSYVIDSGILKMSYSSETARDNLYQISYDDDSEGLDFFMT